MKIGKIIAFAVSVLFALNFISIFADAEEREEYTLISAPMSAIPDVKSLEDIGGGYYLCRDKEGTAFKFIYIGNEEISKWRETGKFIWKDVECNIELDLENYYGCNSEPSEEGNFFGIVLRNDKYIEFYYCESSDDHTRITAELFNNVFWAYVNPDGYVFAKQFGHYCFGKGTEISEIDFGDTDYSQGFSLNTGEYIGGVFFGSRWYDPTPHYAALRLADKNGNVTEVYNSTPKLGEDNYCSDISLDTMFICQNGLKNLHWRETYINNGVETRLNKIYCFDSGELLTFPHNDTLPDGRTVLFIDLEDGVFNGRAIMNITLRDSNNYTAYALVNTETGEYVSDGYQSLSTRDGEHYLAYDENGWTLIDGDGNSLCDFDDVTEFYGGIAMACENGEGFLIDGNMERISDTVPAESAYMGNDENIFIASLDGEYYFVTYVKNVEKTESPETGNISVLALAVCTAASGAVIVKTGKKKRYNKRQAD